MQIFISYAREDYDIAEDLYSHISFHGFSPWMDKKDLIGGVNWEKALEEAISNSDAVVFIFSENSVSKRGVFQKEIKLALNKAEYLLDNDIFILPIKIGAVVPPSVISHIQWIDYDEENWKDKILQSLKEAAIRYGFNDNPTISYVADSRDEKENFTTEWRYPVVSLDNKEIESEVNSMIQSKVHEQVHSLRKLMLEERSWEQISDAKMFCDVSGTVSFFNSRFISMQYEAYHYLGGAHPNSHRAALNILLNDKISINGNDLVLERRDLIERIIEKIDTEFPEEFSLMEIESDRRNQIDNNIQSKTVINNDGIFVIFDQYEYFSYATGPFSIDISWAELKAIGLSNIGNRVHFAMKGHNI